MARIVRTESAVDDLQEIAAFIAQDDEAAAVRLAGKAVDAVEALAVYPRRGRVVPELALDHLRETVVPPCRILYRVGTESVTIMRIIRGEQDLLGTLRREGPRP